MRSFSLVVLFLQLVATSLSVGPRHRRVAAQTGDVCGDSEEVALQESVRRIPCGQWLAGGCMSQTLVLLPPTSEDWGIADPDRSSSARERHEQLHGLRAIVAPPPLSRCLDLSSRCLRAQRHGPGRTRLVEETASRPKMPDMLNPVLYAIGIAHIQ